MTLIYNKRNTYAIIDENGRIIEKFRTATCCHMALFKFNPRLRKTMKIKRIREKEVKKK